HRARGSIGATINRQAVGAAARVGRAVEVLGRPGVARAVQALTESQRPPEHAEPAVVRGVRGAGGRLRSVVVRVWLRTDLQRGYRT
ncbi:MAG: hypothetical protein ACRDQJ_17190, partial [Pseudonocardiaceae bacterium]